MKIRNLIYILLIVPFLFGGSCEKRKFSFVSKVNQVVTFEDIETDDEVYRTFLVSTNDIKKSLDVPSDGEVTDVFIKAFRIAVIPTSANTVDEISTSAVIIGSDGLRKMLWPKQFAATLYSTRTKHINELVQEGVNYLKNVIEEALYSNYNTNYTFGLEVFPIGELFSADIKVTMEVQVEYEQCIEVWDYLEAGEECD